MTDLTLKEQGDQEQTKFVPAIALPLGLQAKLVNIKARGDQPKVDNLTTNFVSSLGHHFL